MVVGRDAERAALIDALTEAAAGRARRVLLVGDPGAGRSTLLQAVAEHARSIGFHVLAAACPEGSADLRYGLVDDLAHCRPELLAGLPPEDSALLGDLTVRAVPGPARVATALLRLLSAADRTGPVLLVVDDLHAADPDSMAALTFATGRLVGRRVAVVASAVRQSVSDPRLRAWEPVDLGPLDLPAAVAVLRAAMPAHLRDCISDERAAHLADLLGRNPAALRECPRVLSEAEMRGDAPIPDPIPVGERLLAGWRTAFDELTGPQQDALLAALVTAGQGRPLCETVLARAGTSIAAHTAGGLALGGRAHGPEGPTDAGAALLRQALLACAGPERVGRMHGLAAVAADDLGLPPAIVVGHLQRSAGQLAGSVELLEGQSSRALEIGQVATAVRALIAAARLVEDPERHAHLAARAARLRVGLGDADEDAGPLLEILTTARLSPDQQVWAEWLRAQHVAADDLRASLHWMSRSVRSARQADPGLVPTLALAASFQAWAVGDGPSALSLADVLLDHEADPASCGTATSSPPTTPPWTGLALRGVARFQVGDVSASDGDLAAARAMSAAWQLTPDVPVPMLVNVVLLDEVMGTGRRFADPRLDMAMQRVEESGEMLGILRNVQAARALRRGDLTLARALVDEGLDLARAVGSAHSILLRLCTAVRLDALAGDRAELSSESAELRSLAVRMGHASGPPYADRADGLIALAELRPVDAAAALTPLTEDLLLGMGPTDPVLMGRGDLVEALVHIGDPTGARAVHWELRSLLGESQDVRARALLARTTAILAGGSESVAGLREAVHLWRAAHDAFELARSRMQLGEALLAAGHRGAAAVELGAAARSFDLMGAAPWAARTRVVLAGMAGLAEGLPAAHEPALALTAAELRVARAIADGSTNKEVAQRLSLSPRTVEHHLAAAYRKLGVRSRTALVARMAGASSSD